MKELLLLLFLPLALFAAEGRRIPDATATTNPSTNSWLIIYDGYTDTTHKIHAPLFGDWLEMLGLNATNLTAGTIATARLPATLQDLAADGTLSGSSVGSGINADYLTSGTVASARLPAGVQDLAADGILSGTAVGPGISGLNITVGTLPEARLPSTAALDTEVTAAISAHEADTTGVHGIADTSAIDPDQLAGDTVDDNLVDEAIIAGTIARDSEVAAAVSAHESDTTAVHGVADMTAFPVDWLAGDSVDDGLIDVSLISGDFSNQAQIDASIAAATNWPALNIGVGTITNQYGETITITGALAADTVADSEGDLRSGIAQNAADINAVKTGVNQWTSRQEFFDFMIKRAPYSDYLLQTNANFTVNIGTEAPLVFAYPNAATVTLAMGSVPTAGTKVDAYQRWIFYNDTGADVQINLPEGVASLRGDFPSGIVHLRHLEVVFIQWFDGTVKLWWAGPTDAELAMEDGGTNVPTGVAPAGIDKLGTIDWTSLTNASLQLRSGTAFRLPHNQDVYIQGASSRLTPAETNSYVLKRYVFSPPAASLRYIVWDTNNFSLIGGLTQTVTNQPGIPFAAWITDYGEGVGEMFADGGGTGAEVAGGGGSTDPAAAEALADLQFVLEMEHASGSHVDELGTYNFSSEGGSFTYQAAGLVGNYCLTNPVPDTTLGIYNNNAALQRAGADAFSISTWIVPRANSSSFANRYDAADVALRSWHVGLNSSGLLEIRGYNTSNAQETLNTSWNPPLGQWAHVFITYDPTANSLSVSYNGQPFQTKVFASQLRNVARGLYFGTYAYVGGTGSPLALDQCVGWSATKSLAVGQYIYNNGIGRPYANW